MYVELHTRSAFSFLEGGSLPEELISACASQSMPAVALLDRDGVYGAPRFHMAAKKSGVRAHLGAEVSVQEAGLQSIAPAWIKTPATPQPVRYSLLVETTEGYRNLCRLITQYKLREKAKGEGRATMEELQAHAKGLVCLTGGAEGPMAAALIRGGYDAARKEVECLIQIFGPSNVYVELQRHFDRQEEFRNQAAVRIAHSLKLPLLATNGVRYARPEDRELLDVLTCIRHHCSLQTAGRLLESNAERHFRSAGDMARHFADLPEAIANTAELSARLGFTLADLGYEFPKYPVPEGETMMSFLRQRTEEGLCDRYLPKHDSALLKRAQNQINRELQLIDKLHLEGYFLIVWDIVRFCRQEGILVQGRGSAANSAVCYALGITAIDPVGMELLFERFLSEERGEWPDIDLDLPSGDDRERAIQYVYQRYGKLGAAMTANVITYRGRSAAREAGKALGFDPDTLNRLASLIGSWEWKGTTDTLEHQFGRAGFDLEHPRIVKYLELSMRLQDLPRHLGQHSGGMVICQGQLDSVVPLEPASMPGRVVVQWDKDDCADMGIVKVDLLGLGMMAVLKDCLTLVPQHYGEPLDLAQLPQDDPEVYHTLQQADTVGMFQVESRAQMSALPRNRPERFYDLVVQVAIIRPGPIVGKMMNPYMKRRQGREPVRYAHPSLEPILKRTLGVPLFQEQLLRIAMTAANFTGGEAEELRRAMGHKRSRERMLEIENKLRRGMEHNGIGIKEQDEIITSIASFALYGFPESHAASFALIAYASAYLKCHYLAAFTAALLNNQPMGFYSAATIVKDAQRHGLRVKPVDVLHSEWLCTLEPANSPENSLGRGGAERQRSRSAGVGLFLCSKTPLKSPLVQGGTIFSSNVVPQRGMRGFLEERFPSSSEEGMPGQRPRQGWLVKSTQAVGRNPATLRTTPAAATVCCPPLLTQGGESMLSFVSQPVAGESPILRLGLRYVRGLRKNSADALVRARDAGPFSSIEDLTLRVPELSKNEWTMLAQIGALNGLGDRFHRRDALWQVERAVRPAGALFKQSQQEDAPSPLSQMTDEERLVADFHGTGVTVGRHPMAHRRAEWNRMNIQRACDLKTIPDGRFTRIAGCVIARQRPGTAKGFLFLSLEDETGIANAIVTPDVYERNRILLTSGKFLMIEGILQNQDNVISVRARRIQSLSVTAAETESHDFH